MPSAETLWTLSPELIADVKLYPTSLGGRKSPASPGWGCPCCCSKASPIVGYDGWPLLGDTPLALGDQRRLGFVFLSGSEAAEVFRKAGKFFLWERGFIGEAIVVEGFCKKETKMIEQLLKSSPLSQVIFVHDYIQLIFRSISLSIFNKVELHSNGTILKRKDLGFCDSLIFLIGQSVAKIEIEDDKDFRITFENLTTLVISLHPNDAISPEAFQLMHGQGVIIVG